MLIMLLELIVPDNWCPVDKYQNTCLAPSGHSVTGQICINKTMCRCSIASWWRHVPFCIPVKVVPIVLFKSTLVDHWMIRIKC